MSPHVCVCMRLRACALCVCGLSAVDGAVCARMYHPSSQTTTRYRIPSVPYTSRLHTFPLTPLPPPLPLSPVAGVAIRPCYLFGEVGVQARHSDDAPRSHDPPPAMTQHPPPSLHGQLLHRRGPTEEFPHKISLHPLCYPQTQRQAPQEPSLRQLELTAHQRVAAGMPLDSSFASVGIPSRHLRVCSYRHAPAGSQDHPRSSREQLIHMPVTRHEITA